MVDGWIDGGWNERLKERRGRDFCDWCFIHWRERRIGSDTSICMHALFFTHPLARSLTCLLLFIDWLLNFESGSDSGSESNSAPEFRSGSAVHYCDLIERL